MGDTATVINLVGLAVAAGSVIVALVMGVLGGKYLQRNQQKETELDLVRSVGKLEGRAKSGAVEIADGSMAASAALAVSAAARTAMEAATAVAVIKAVVDRVEMRLGEVSRRTHEQATSIQTLTYDSKHISEALDRIEGKVEVIETKQAENRAAAASEHQNAATERVALKGTLESFERTVASFRRRISTIEQKLLDKS